MREFKNYLMSSDNYLGPVSDAQVREDHQSILAFAAGREDLVNEFESQIHSVEHSEWLERAANGVKYHIERLDSHRDRYGRSRLTPDIQPMIWSDSSGKVAVIKVTM